MSTIRYFDHVPHIVRYGMQDDEKQKSWMLFWRCGTGFTVDVDHNDVRGTPFAETWLELLVEPRNIAEQANWVTRWDGMCDCVIEACLPLLRKLAPEEGKWVSLGDYLHTPSYKLKVTKAEEGEGVEGVVVEGLKDKPAYEAWPTAKANIEYLGDDTTRVSAKELVVLGQEKDWRRPPVKVKGVDGEVCFFKACEKTSHNMTNDTISNSSIDAINTYCRLAKLDVNSPHLPALKAVVVTEPSPDIEDSSPGTDWKDDPRTNHQSQQRQADELVAGVLLTYFSHSETLADVFKDESTKPSDEQRAIWKGQILDTVHHLHEHSVTVGSHEGVPILPGNKWHAINKYTVHVSERDASGGGKAWLDLGVGCQFHKLDGDKDGEAYRRFTEERARDLNAVEDVFDGK